jgi:hypothetical protein
MALVLFLPRYGFSPIATGRGSAQGWSYEDTGGETMIKKVKGGYKVLSESGKNIGGPYKSKAQAEKRLRQVEFFKHRKG